MFSPMATNHTNLRPPSSMTASDLTAEQMLNKAIAWLAAQSIVKDQATIAKLRKHCLPTESDKQKALMLLLLAINDPFFKLSADQARLICGVVERCPDDYSQSTKPKLALGQKWLRRDGEVVIIDGFSPRAIYPFSTSTSTGTEWYTSEGYYHANRAESPYDLVECLYSPSCEH
jgi:hypothetical protein